MKTYVVYIVSVEEESRRKLRIQEEAPEQFVLCSRQARAVESQFDARGVEC